MTPCLDKVVVSTDSSEIAEVARGFGAEVPFLRPANLATAVAPTFSAVEHALDYYRNKEHLEFDYTVLLEPTCCRCFIRALAISIR